MRIEAKDTNPTGRSSLRPLAAILATLVLSATVVRADDGLQQAADEMETSVDGSEASDDSNRRAPEPSRAPRRNVAAESRSAELPASDDAVNEDPGPSNETARPGIALCGRMDNRRRRVESTCQQAKIQSGQLREELNKRCTRQREEFNGSYLSCPGFKRF